MCHMIMYGSSMRDVSMCDISMCDILVYGDCDV